MKKRSTNNLKLQKSVISNLQAIKAGGPPLPPGSNSCPEEMSCVSCGKQICN